MPRFQPPVSHNIYTPQSGPKVLGSAEWKVFAKRFKLPTKGEVQLELTEEMRQSPEYALLSEKYSLPTLGNITLDIGEGATATTRFTLQTLDQGQLVAV